MLKTSADSRALAAPTHAHSCTRFERFNDPQGTRLPLSDLLSALRSPLPRDTPKEELPLFSPATFVDDCRAAQNIEKAFALGFDVDKNAPGLEDLKAGLEGRAGFLYTSSSHTPEAPRWRVVLYLSRPVNAQEYRALWRELAASLPFSVAVAIGQEAKDCSRQWFYPREPEQGEYVWRELSGEAIDVDAVLASAPPVQESEGELPASGWRWLIRDVESPAKVLRPHFVEGQRHALTMELAGAAFWSGLSEEDALTFVQNVADDEDPKRREIVRRTYVLGASGAEVSGWPALETRIGKAAALEAKDLLVRGPQWRAFVTSRSQADNDTNGKEGALPLGVVFGGLDDEDKPIEWLVSDILPAGSVAMFVAEPYTLKTFAALDLAIAVAHGRPWLKRHACKKGRVVFVNFEMSGGELKRRLRLLHDDGGLVGRVSHPDVCLADEDFWSSLVALEPSLVVIDTLSAGNPEVEEKDPRAATPLRRAAKIANDTGCTFLFVHHTTKDAAASKKNRVRGSGAIFGALDVCYFFGALGATGATSEVECIKMRSGPEPAKFAIRLTDAKGLELDTSEKVARLAVKTPEDLEAAITLCIRQNGPDVPGAIARRIGKRAQDVRLAMGSMRERGDLVIIGKRHHLDSPDERKSRILAAIHANDLLSSASQVARHAHVSTQDVRDLELNHVIGRTSESDLGRYIVFPSR